MDIPRGFPRASTGRQSLQREQSALRQTAGAIRQQQAEDQARARDLQQAGRIIGAEAQKMHEREVRTEQLKAATFINRGWDELKAAAIEEDRAVTQEEVQALRTQFAAERGEGAQHLDELESYLDKRVGDIAGEAAVYEAQWTRKKEFEAADEAFYTATEVGDWEGAAAALKYEGYTTRQRAARKNELEAATTQAGVEQFVAGLDDIYSNFEMTDTEKREAAAEYEQNTMNAANVSTAVKDAARIEGSKRRQQFDRLSADIKERQYQTYMHAFDSAAEDGVLTREAVEYAWKNREETGMRNTDYRRLIGIVEARDTRQKVTYDLEQMIADGTPLIAANGQSLVNTMFKESGREAMLLQWDSLDEPSKRYVTDVLKLGWMPAQMKNILDQGVTSDTAYADSAADLYSYTSENVDTRSGFKRLSPRTVAFYENVEAKVRAGIPRPVASQQVQEFMAIPPEQREGLRDAYRKEDADNQRAFKQRWNDFADDTAGMVGQGGAIEELPASLVTAYEAAVEEHYLLTGDLDVAQTAAFKQLRSMVGPSQVNGEGGLMLYPPEEMYGVDTFTIQQDVSRLMDETGYENATRLRLVSDTRTGLEDPPTYRIQYVDENGMPDYARFPDGRPRRYKYERPTEEELAATAEEIAQARVRYAAEYDRKMHKDLPVGADIPVQQELPGARKAYINRQIEQEFMTGVQERFNGR